MTANRYAGIIARNEIARDIVAGFASGAPTLAGVFGFIESALADVPAVLAELERTRAELAAARLDRANLLAAMRAAVGADAGGEPDPLYYLRDELKASRERSQGPAVP
jgi:hypothetical protein